MPGHQYVICRQSERFCHNIYSSYIEQLISWYLCIASNLHSVLKGYSWNIYTVPETFYFPSWTVSERWAHPEQINVECTVSKRWMQAEWNLVSTYERWANAEHNWKRKVNCERTENTMWTQDERFIRSAYWVIPALCFIGNQEKITNELRVIILLSAY